MSVFKFRWWLFTFSIAFYSTSVSAAPGFLGKNGNWQAFTHGNSCFMVSEPTKQEGTFSKRGKPHILITHAPAKKTFDTVSVVAGYSYKPQSEVEVRIGNSTSTLFTKDDTAWARDAESDQAIVAGMKAGSTLQAEGTSARGNAITDTYSLSGFSATYALIEKACPRKGGAKNRAATKATSANAKAKSPKAKAKSAKAKSAKAKSAKAKSAKAKSAKKTPAKKAKKKKESN